MSAILSRVRSGSFVDTSPGVPPPTQGIGGATGGQIHRDKEIDSLLDETNELMEKLKAAETLRRSEPPTLFNLQPVRLRNWRIRRQDSQITTSFDSLFPRLVKAVEETTIVSSEIDEKTIALRDQAAVLKIRLNACMCYNTEYLANRSGMVDEMRLIVDMLSAYSTEIKAMITFNIEVIRQKLVQSVSQGKGFVSWGSRSMLMRPISESELGDDADHVYLMQKLRFIRESKEDLMGRLTDLLELRELHTVNLEAATVAYTEICDLVASVNENMQIPRLSDSNSSPNVAPYDHSTCPDCQVIYTMAEQCIDHLSSLIRQQDEIKSWCDSLSAAKEKVEHAKVEINRFYDMQVTEGSSSEPSLSMLSRESSDFLSDSTVESCQHTPGVENGHARPETEYSVDAGKEES